MDMAKITFGGHEFELEVYLECYPGETVLESQQTALKDLLKNQKGMDEALVQLKKYLFNENKDQFPDGFQGDIFDYVAPRTIYIPHTEKYHRSAILCDCTFDEEHGLAIIFKDGKFEQIGSQDLII